jgi:hypothetical protein
MAALAAGMEDLFCLIASLRSLFKNRRELALENRDKSLRFLPDSLSPVAAKKGSAVLGFSLRVWRNWRESLIVVKPDTVVR